MFAYNYLYFYSLRDAGNVVAGESRRLGHLRDIFVRVLRFNRRLLFSPIVQNYAGSRVEKSRFTGKSMNLIIK